MGSGQERGRGREPLSTAVPSRKRDERAGPGSRRRGGRHLGGEEGAGPDSRCGHCGRVMVTFPARKSDLDLAEGAGRAA